MFNNITDETYVLISSQFIIKSLILFLLLGLGSWLGRRERDNRNLWERAREPVPRSFESSTAPLIVAQRGCRGLLFSWIYGISKVITYVIVAVYMIDWLSPQLDIIFWVVSRLSRSFA